LITITPDEIGVARLVRFSGHATVDWSSFRVVGTPPAIQITGLRVDGSGATCAVSGLLDPEQEELDGTILAHARAIAGGSEGSEGKVIEVALKIPVRATQLVQFAASPRTPVVRFAGSPATGRARIMLRGKLLRAEQNPITNISSPGFSVAWRLSPVSESGTAILDITMTKSDSSELNAEGLLVLTFGHSIAKQLAFLAAGTLDAGQTDDKPR
jgi:hypothetical protein